MRVIKINALWCPSCIIMNKRVRTLALEYGFELVELDYDFDEDEVKKYSPGKILPVLVFLDSDGNEQKRLIGEKNDTELKEVIEKLK